LNTQIHTPVALNREIASTELGIVWFIEELLTVFSFIGFLVGFEPLSNTKIHTPAPLERGIPSTEIGKV